MAAVKSRRLGLKYNPPTIMLEYTQGYKTRVCSVKLKNVPAPSDIDEIAKKVCSRFPGDFVRSEACLRKVKSLLGRLSQKPKPAGSVGGAGATRPATTKDPAGADNIDLNKVSPEELEEYKAKMDDVFEKTRLRPGDKGFVYDKQVDFPTDNLESNEWDEGEDYSTENDDDDKF
eukprot:jgi/Mesvir1/3662/Mv14953-RA.1